MTLQGTKALEKWCRVVTEGYAGVNIVNMSTSWRSGLGFCAVIHHFRPELIDFASLDPDDALANNRLAFDVAEQHLGIPSLLDPNDMVECELLDRLSILTYISQFFQAFHGATASSAASLAKRGHDLPVSPAKAASSSSSSAAARTAASSMVALSGRRNDPCKICGVPVFILERLNVSGKLLHRTCFKCARCHAQLNVHNYYETESGRYCCDMCPDEEKCITDAVEASKKVRAEEKVERLEDSGVDESSSSASDEDEMEVIVNGVKEQQTTLPDLEQGVNDIVKEVAVVVEEEKGQTGDGMQRPPEETIVSQVRELDVVGLNLSSPAEATTENCVVHETEPESPLAGEVPTSESQLDHDGPEFSANKEGKDALPVETVVANPTIQCPNTMNPFGDEDNDEDEEAAPVSAGDERTIDAHTSANVQRESTNPFGDDDEDEEDEDSRSSNKHIEDNQLSANERPVAVAAASTQGTPLTGPPKPPRASLNPFGSDFEDDDAENDSRPSSSASPSPSTGALKSRKKRPAPKPPGLSSSTSNTPTPSPRSSKRDTYQQHEQQQPTPAPRGSMTPHLRPAPPPRPPSPALSVSSSGSYGHRNPAPPVPQDLAKDRKERDNQKRRSQQILEAAAGGSGDFSAASTPVEPTAAAAAAAALSLSPMMSPAKQGEWKKKKGPAPPRPIPQKRQVKKLPRKAVNTELHDIEIKQQELERQGVRLEKTIRELCVKNDRERSEQGLDNNDRESLGPEVEDLIIQLFDLVNEKNDLYRRQTELMYMKRDHRLEEEHADIEHQIRLLMARPDSQRTEEDRAKEEQLIARLMEIVSQRNEIVDCLEMDRLRELDEDESIEIHMEEYAAVKPVEDDDASKKKKKKKKKSKEKEKKKKKKEKGDEDKDIDTSEFPGGAPAQQSPKKISSEKDKTKKLKKKILASLTMVPSMKKA